LNSVNERMFVPIRSFQSSLIFGSKTGDYPRMKHLSGAPL
jgi:hypothetical protein